MAGAKDATEEIRSDCRAGSREFSAERGRCGGVTVVVCMYVVQ